MRIKKPKMASKAIKDPEGVASIFRAILKLENEEDRQKEHFWAIGLTTRNVVKYIELVSLGTLSASLVHPREVYKLAVVRSAASVILCHNHPSGDPEPSEDDIKITKRIFDSGKILGIETIDHIIVGSYGSRFYSFKEHGLL